MRARPLTLRGGARDLGPPDLVSVRARARARVRVRVRVRIRVSAGPGRSGPSDP